MHGLTAPQSKLLEYLGERHKSGLYPPTLREISDQFDWSSQTAAAHHLDALVKKGYIRRKTSASRGIEMVYQVPK